MSVRLCLMSRRNGMQLASAGGVQDGHTEFVMPAKLPGGHAE